MNGPPFEKSFPYLYYSGMPVPDELNSFAALVERSA